MLMCVCLPVFAPKASLSADRQENANEQQQAMHVTECLSNNTSKFGVVKCLFEI